MTPYQQESHRTSLTIGLRVSIHKTKNTTYRFLVGLFTVISISEITNCEHFKGANGIWVLRTSIMREFALNQVNI